MDELRHDAPEARSAPPCGGRLRGGLRDQLDSQLIGATVADFYLLQVLGQGGMGTVYLAEGVGPNAGQRAAIKVLAPHISEHPQVVARFEAEAHTITRIDHPNVIRVLDYGALPDGTLYHVMELAEGRELQELLEERPPLSALEAAPFVDQICRGLQAAHDSGVIHRDLKPENIIVLRERPLSLKLLDFGIAKLLDPGDWVRLTATGMVLGTPLFIAPEQALGDLARIGPRTDLYSLGVLLYTMLAGQPPFYDESPGLLLARHIRDDAPPLRALQPALPEAVARIVHRCLEKDPARRHGSARELAEAYLAALGPAAYGDLDTIYDDAPLDGLDTVYDDSPPAGLDTIVDTPGHHGLDAIEGDAGPGVLDAPDDHVPPTGLTPTVNRRRRLRNFLAIGLAAAAILLIILLLALTAYLAAT